MSVDYWRHIVVSESEQKATSRFPHISAEEREKKVWKWIATKNCKLTLVDEDFNINTCRFCFEFIISHQRKWFIKYFISWLITSHAKLEEDPCEGFPSKSDFEAFNFISVYNV